MSEMDDIAAAPDFQEEARVMDGNILRQEKFSSVSLGRRFIITYLDSGAIDSIAYEDI